MAEPIRIQGKYLTASETADALGVSKKRADHFIKMVRESDTGLDGIRVKFRSRAAKKKSAGRMTFFGRKGASELELFKQQKPIKKAGKKTSTRLVAIKRSQPVNGTSVKTSAKSYASKKAVSKKN